MIDIVIFGTGTGAERAWQAAAARSDINVIAFADNNPAKQGTRFHDRPVVAPAAIADLQYDFVVLASMYAPEIERQLLGLGLPASALFTPNLAAMADAFGSLPPRQRLQKPLELDDGRSVARGDLPRLLVLTYETFNSTHGTGVLLQRYFADWPVERLFSVCHTATGTPWLPNSLVLAPGASPAERGALLADELKTRGFQPDLVYATAFNENDLDLLEAVLAALPPGIPVVQHFMDYMPHDQDVFDTRFRRLADRVGEVWALTEGMAGALQRRLARPVHVVTALHQEPPPAWKQSHPSDAGRCRALMLGNLWQPWMLPVVRGLWRRLQARLPGLAPIDWYVHPARVQSLLESGYELGDEVVWRGFYTGRALQERLQAADLALLPFNKDAEARDGYTRYSLPSRLTELCGAGLPIFAIASPDTEPARFLAAHGCGEVGVGVEIDALAGRLHAFLQDRDRRIRCGGKARRVAEGEFAFAPFHRKFLGDLVRLAERFRRPVDWTGPRKEGLVRLAGSERSASARLEDVLTDRVHYACGRNVLPGWLNVDGYDESFPYGAIPEEMAKRIFRLDLTGAHPFPNDCFRLGYSEDFVEHIDQPQFVAFLCECFRTFRRGGILRISTPGLAGILRRHLRGADWSAAETLKAEAYTRWWHKHFLCFAEVDAIARHIGWREVRECAYGESACAELCLENRPEQADLNLVVELVK